MAAAPVSVWLPGQLAPVYAGTFEWEAAARTGQFRHAQAYLDDPAALALDPIHLPRRAGAHPQAGRHLRCVARCWP